MCYLKELGAGVRQDKFGYNNPIKLLISRTPHSEIHAKYTRMKLEKNSYGTESKLAKSQK